MNINFDHPFAPTSQVGILNHLMGAGGPHWCEDPVVDRENEVAGDYLLGGSSQDLFQWFNNHFVIV